MWLQNHGFNLIYWEKLGILYVRYGSMVCSMCLRAIFYGKFGLESSYYTLVKAVFPKGGTRLRNIWKND